MLNGWCKKNVMGAFQRRNSKWKGDLERLDLWKIGGSHFNRQCYQIELIRLLVWMDLAWLLQILQDIALDKIVGIGLRIGFESLSDAL